jgi:hypothetical protein
MNAISLRPNGLNGFLKILYAVSCQLSAVSSGFIKLRWGGYLIS